ncbi:SDR family oxidoreductase [Streptomyces sp. IB2014 016-6]|uniref:SDR family oxidoreductase n=1 Tax=Streptomyces sp. IB2014 016-6 TaxID=2517818 RepID=UPI0011C7E51B|nr:SDR family oxidoreductase [Streptomyces sp. IB2014 016-6]TXL90024.1 NAD-dependent epimerase/dehydratase family protein [Streptomyces sp. IB2014 016-6]
MHVALTGATGFLGLRLLRRLLDTHRSVTVLVHAGSGDALHRITRYFALTGVPEAALAELPGRLRVVETELERPGLGLSRHAFQELADGLGAIWHSAGSINLAGDLAELRRTNVEGTRHVLELAAAGRERPVVHHVSTAFVAGSRREGVAYEDELDGAYGFENAYERSKYEAEVLIHAWSREHRRPVVVLRPSILVTDLPPHPELPSHPLQVVERILRDARRTAEPGCRARVRLVGRPDGRLNLLQVDHAAGIMVRLADRTPSGGVDTYHVVHDRDVPVPTIVTLLERLVELSVELVAEEPDDPSALEALVDCYPDLTTYLTHRRRFDDTRVRTLFGSSVASDRVDLDHLWSGLVPRGLVAAGPSPTSALPSAPCA